MTTMTIHAEAPFAEALRAYAAKLGKSVNQTVKDVFVPILGLADSEQVERVNRWSRFCGCIPKSEARSVKDSLAEQRTVDEDDWR